MPNEKQPEIVNLSQVLQDEDMELRNISDDNNELTIFDHEAGEEFVMPTEQFLENTGLNESGMQVEFNSPKTAVDRSPLDVMDRFKLAAGNAKGNMKFLGDKFEAVTYDEEKGLVVRDAGVWKTVDPTGLGEGGAWEATKDLVEFLPTFAAKGAAMMAGAAKGAAIGSVASPVGSVIGGVVGAGVGAFAAEGAESLYGKLAKTYDATPSEVLADMSLEAVAAMGGYVIPVAGKAVLSKMFNAFGNIAKNGAPQVKSLAASLLARTTSQHPAVTERLFSRAGPVNRMMDSLTKMKGLTDVKAREFLRVKAVDNTAALFKGARKELSNSFASAEKEFLNSVPKNFRVNQEAVSKLTADVLAPLEKQGLVNSAIVNNKKVYSVIDKKEFLNLMARGDVEPLVTKAVHGKLSDFVGKMSQLGNSQKGSGITDIITARRNLDDILFRKNGVLNSPALSDIVKPMSLKMREGLVDEVKKTGTQSFSKYVKANRIFSDNIDDVVRIEQELGRKASGSVNRKALEAFTRKLDKVDEYAEANRLLSTAGRLQSNRGQILVDNIRDMTAARGFVQYLPRLGPLQAAAIGTGIGITTIGAEATLPLAATALAISSPRLSAKAIAYLSKRFFNKSPPRGTSTAGFANRVREISGRAPEYTAQDQSALRAIPGTRMVSASLKKMTPEQLGIFMKDPAAFANVIRAVGESARVGPDQQMADQLLQQVGMTGNKGQQ